MARRIFTRRIYKNNSAVSIRIRRHGSRLFMQWMICRRHGGRLLVATLGQASRHHLICNLWNVTYSALDFRPEHRVVGCGRILDSISWCKALGGGAGTLKRTFAAGFSRDFSGTGLPIGELCRRSTPGAAAGLAGNESSSGRMKIRTTR